MIISDGDPIPISDRLTADYEAERARSFSIYQGYYDRSIARLKECGDILVEPPSPQLGGGGLPSDADLVRVENMLRDMLAETGEVRAAAEKWRAAEAAMNLGGAKPAR